MGAEKAGAEWRKGWDGIVYNEQVVTLVLPPDLATPILVPSWAPLALVFAELAALALLDGLVWFLSSAASGFPWYLAMRWWRVEDGMHYLTWFFLLVLERIMWELDCEEGWAPKNWCFWTVVLEKILESPLHWKEIQPVHPKGNQSWMFIGRTDVKAKTPIL